MIYKKFTFKEKKFFLKFHLLLLHFKIKESSPNSKKQLLFSHSGHPKFQQPWQLYLHQGKLFLHLLYSRESKSKLLGAHALLLNGNFILGFTQIKRVGWPVTPSIYGTSSGKITRVFKEDGSLEPHLMIYDCHLSHVNYETIKFSREQKITVLKLPPHTTDTLQPLDVSVLKSLKENSLGRLIS